MPAAALKAARAPPRAAALEKGDATVGADRTHGCAGLITAPCGEGLAARSAGPATQDFTDKSSD